MAEVMSMIPDESPANELNADEQDSLQVGEQMEEAQDQRLAGKYKNAQELEAAYIELQKKLGDQKSEPTEEPETAEDSPEEEDVSILDKLWEESQSEYTPETLQEIAKTDPQKLAEAYLQYRAKAESQPTMTADDAASIRNMVGGDDSYSQIIGWAGENLSEQEISMFDSVMERGDPVSAMFAVQALAYRYRDANGYEGDLVQGKAPSTSGASFRSQAELVQAMSDPRYDNDPAYRQDVMRKLDNSNIAF